MNDKDIRFENNVDRLRKARKYDTDMIDSEFESFVDRFALTRAIDAKPGDGGNIDVNNKLSPDVIMMIALSVFLALFGLININNYSYYLFGILFFLVGFFIGIFIKYFGIIFMFSHGGCGFFIMLSALLSSDDFFSINFSDLGSRQLTYLEAAFGILIFTVLFNIIFNCSNRLKENKFYKVILLLLYTVVVVMIGLFPKIY